MIRDYYLLKSQSLQLRHAYKSYLRWFSLLKFWKVRRDIRTNFNRSYINYCRISYSSISFSTSSLWIRTTSFPRSSSVLRRHITVSSTLSICSYFVVLVHFTISNSRSSDFSTRKDRFRSDEFQVDHSSSDTARNNFHPNKNTAATRLDIFVQINRNICAMCWDSLSRLTVIKASVTTTIYSNDRMMLISILPIRVQLAVNDRQEHLRHPEWPSIKRYPRYWWSWSRRLIPWTDIICIKMYKSITCTWTGRTAYLIEIDAMTKSIVKDNGSDKSQKDTSGLTIWELILWFELSIVSPYHMCFLIDLIMHSQYFTYDLILVTDFWSDWRISSISNFVIRFFSTLIKYTKQIPPEILNYTWPPHIATQRVECLS